MATENKTDIATIPKGMEGMVTTQRPEGADQGLLGNEGIGKDDILMPRLGLAQKMSPEIDLTNQARYIEGLTFTGLFNSQTKVVYGTGPLHFVILRRDDPRFVEFNPIDQGGGIKDMNVPPGDPRTMFTTGLNGERVKPLATMFYDFIVLLLNDFDPSEPMKNIVALSMKSSAIKTAKHLNMLITQRGQKLICKGVYELRTGSETDKKTQGVYAIYKVKNAGWLKPDSPIEQVAIQMHEAWRTRSVKIDREPGDDFDPRALDSTVATGATTEM
jgi:hypothetical protein